MILTLLKILLFIMIFGAVYFILKKTIDEKLIKIHFNKLIKRTVEESEKRELEREKEIELQGTANDDDLLTKLDIMIEHSGIKHYIPALNANLLLIFSLVVFLVTFLISAYVTFSIIRALSIGIIAISFIALIILIMSLINFAKTENEIITFINLLQNYSRLSSDIASIMGQISPFLNEPLRTATEECHLDCVRTGNIEQSLETLAKKIHHKKLSTIIQNIAICSKYEADYETIINDSRSIIQEFLAGRQQRKIMIRNAIIEISMILGIGTFLIFLLNSSMEVNIINALLTTQVGNVILVYLIIVLILIVFTFFKESYRDD